MQAYQYYVKKKKCGKKAKLIAFFMCVILVFAFFLLYLNFVITPLVTSSGEGQLKVLATKSINFAIAQTLNNEVSYNDLVDIQTDSHGRVCLIEAKANKINSLSNSIAKLTLEKLISNKTFVEIPLGAFFGIPLFSGYGPNIKIQIFPYGEVKCNFLSQFVSAGINQTQHKIYANILASVNIVLPFRTIKVNIENEVLICESILIGQIPETYLQSSNLSDMVNLIK